MISFFVSNKRSKHFLFSKHPNMKFTVEHEAENRLISPLGLFRARCIKLGGKTDEEKELV